ncbi:MAG: DUF368 domain-containing protein [Candidatus Porifericomitaceae bacterium WSBS_2022_MAG_OTU9]
MTIASVRSRYYGYATLAARGFCVGLADLVPGVSGGTMAYLLGIYPRLLQSVAGLAPRRPLARWLQCIDSHFLVPFIFGVMLAILSLTKIFDFPEMLSKHQELWQALFSGLIIGAIAIFMLHRKWLCRRNCLVLAAAFMLGMWLIFQAPTQLPHTSMALVIAGFVAAGVMLVPGISASYLLYIFGLYEIVLGALSNAHLPVLLPFTCGLVVGFILCARFLERLILRNERLSLAIINGLLMASLFRLWPLSGVSSGLPEGNILHWASLLCGLAITYVLHYFSKVAARLG